MSPYISGADRSQAVLFPEVIDDDIPADHPVRVLDAFVAQLDLIQLGFTHALANATVRPPYDPGDLLRLYLYGYLNRVRSSRRFEAEAGRNLELIWLLRRLKPDFKPLPTSAATTARRSRRLRASSLSCAASSTSLAANWSPSTAVSSAPKTARIVTTARPNCARF